MGIESSAHTFGVGIVENGKVLANEKIMYPISDKGMIPAQLGTFHAENADTVIKNALEKADIRINDLEGIGYTKGPGIGHSLQIGQLSAKTLAKTLNIKIACVNHAVAHAEITKHLTKLKDPLVLYVSGGNSQILKLGKGQKRKYKVIGETFDIGIGNMLDSFARELKLNPAWGSSVAKLAERGRYIELPYTVKGMDFSFTGLLTRATTLIGEHAKEDLCYSLQETAFSMLCEATERAVFLTNSKELCVCGGVAQSKRLNEMLKELAKEDKLKFGCAPNEFNADNGAMIAYVAERMLKNNAYSRLEDCDIKQRYRIDSAFVY